MYHIFATLVVLLPYLVAGNTVVHETGFLGVPLPPTVTSGGHACPRTSSPPAPVQPQSSTAVAIVPINTSTIIEQPAPTGTLSSVLTQTPGGLNTTTSQSVPILLPSGKPDLVFNRNWTWPSASGYFNTTTLWTFSTLLIKKTATASRFPLEPMVPPEPPSQTVSSQTRISTTSRFPPEPIVPPGSPAQTVSSVQPPSSQSSRFPLEPIAPPVVPAPTASIAPPPANPSAPLEPMIPSSPPAPTLSIGVPTDPSAPLEPMISTPPPVTSSRSRPPIWQTVPGVPNVPKPPPFPSPSPSFPPAPSPSTPTDSIPGRISLCTLPDFSGDCQILTLPTFQCHNLPPSLSGKVSSIKPDKNQLCIFYDQEGCLGKSDWVRYPGSGNLKGRRFDNVARTWRCSQDGCEGVQGPGGCE